MVVTLLMFLAVVTITKQTVQVFITLWDIVDVRLKISAITKVNLKLKASKPKKNIWYFKGWIEN